MGRLNVRDVSPGFGAEIEGIDLHGELDEESRRTLRKVFDERGLLLFRNLDIDRTEQAYLTDLARLDTAFSMDDAAGIADQQGSFWISNKEPGSAAPFGRLMFHCDMMWSDDPFHVLSLYGVDVEQPAVPTVFASAKHAWDTLPPELRSRAEGRNAVHVTGPEGFDDRRRGGEDGQLLNPVRSEVLSATTAVGHRHPRTGHTLLYVSQGMTKEVADLPHEESEDLLEALFAHLYAPANTWQHEWRKGDLVIWDNIAVQHARSDVRTDGPARTLRKIGSPLPAKLPEHEITSYQPIS